MDFQETLSADSDSVELINSVNMQETLLADSDSVENMNSMNIQAMFPNDSKIVDFEVKSNTDYTVNLRLKCETKEEFLHWLAEYMKLSGNTYRVAVTRPKTGKYVIYKAVYRCQRNTYPASHSVKCPSKKHTGCSAKLNVTIKSPVKGRRVRSKDSLRKDYPTLVTVIQCHNHNTDAAEAAKYKNPGEEIQQKFLNMFKSQHGPSKALELHKRDLFEEHKDQYYKAIADRSLCPDIQWVYRLYYKKFNEEFAPTIVPESTADQVTAHCSIENTDFNKSSESYDWKESEQKLQEIMAVLKEHFDKNPKEISNSINVMHSAFKRMKTQSSLISAMHNFGRIPVQPTLVARRKPCIGSRKCQQTGRLVKILYKNV